MSTFPEKLKNLRKENNLYQKDLAIAVGVSRSAITAYEAGKREPDQATLDKFASLFGVSVDYLLGRTDCRETARKTGIAETAPAYTSPQELDELLLETNLVFNGAPLNKQDKEDLLEIAKVTLDVLKKREPKNRENGK